MTVPPNRSPMSVQDYLALDRDSLEARYEYIDGYAYMMAGGTADHSIIKSTITNLLYSLLSGGPCRVYDSDVRTCLSETRYVYPDIAVSCDARDQETTTMVQFPCLIIEVLSPDTEAYDRGRKFAYYRACPTIQEYLLVDTQQQGVEVYRRARGNRWTLHTFGPDDHAELASRLGVSLPVAALYTGVTLTEDRGTTH